MSTDNSIEVSAATVEAAVKDALDQLGVGEEDVVVEVLATPRAGVLGLGSRDARVRVTYQPAPAARSAVASPPAAPPPPARSDSQPRGRGRERRPDARGNEPHPQQAHGREDSEGGERRAANLPETTREAQALLERILELMGEKAEVSLGESGREAIELEIKGDGSRILIGRHGQTLDALEYVVNRVVARRIKEAAPVVLETEGYRARRRQQLERMALSMGERAKREHQTMRLEPMPPRDRRIIHLALKDDPMLTTRSTGDGFLRAVEIVPIGGRGGREDRENRGRGNRVQDQVRGRAEAEQGGFKHGQKKIF
ncbi:MAG: RNA-binding cell elongation regulator Jag/EloR [Candidatus Binataceae bacterium]